MRTRGRRYKKKEIRLGEKKTVEEVRRRTTSTMGRKGKNKETKRRTGRRKV